MVKKETTNSLLALAAIVVIAAIVGWGLGLIGGEPEVKVKYIPTPAQVSGGGAGEQPAAPPNAVSSTLFDADGYGKYRPAILNPLNTTTNEYKAATILVYKLVNGAEKFYDTVTTVTTGHVTQANALKIVGLDSNGNLQKYVAYVPASDASMTSGRFEFTAAGDVSPTYYIPDQAGLIFKVYDDTAKAYLYGNNETSAGGLHGTGATFNGTVTTDTKAKVGTGGNFDYIIYFETNGTAATDTQFTDQSFLIAIDAQDLSDWKEPTLTLPGATITKLASGGYNDKISNNGNDWVYKVEVNGKPLVVKDAFQKLSIQMYAKAGVDPTDSVAVSFITGGWYQETNGENMKQDTHKDDTSNTAVYTAQTITLQFTTT